MFNYYGPLAIEKLKEYTISHMASCERLDGINGPQMNRWLALSAEHDAMFPILTLKPKSEQRLFQALSDLEHVQDIGNVYGRRTLKNVLQCFEPISALRTPPDKHTGGDTLYAQVAAAYDAYRTGKLDPKAMSSVEDFTTLVLFSVAGKTTTDSAYVSSLTYEEELFGDTVEKTLYSTDVLGEQALRTLDHVTALFEGHHHQIDTAHNNQKLPVQSRIALPAKVVSALIAIDLFVTGCTAHISPTISPTESKPAITAPLPTAEHTKTPTLTPTPTEAPTPTAIAEPDRSSNYPGAVSDRLLTDTTLQEHKTAFVTLMKSNSDVASEARTMESRLKLICSNTCTTEGVLDQARWGIIARNSEGAPLVLQKTTDGGKTWVNVVDASAYSELVANSKFDKTNYRLTPLQWPSGIPADATGEVVTQNNWMVYVWRDKASGKILAWYDAANDQYLTVEGKKINISYIPFEPNVTTWEIASKNIVHWPSNNPDQFKQDLSKLHQYDKPYEPLKDIVSWPSLAVNYLQATNYPKGWQFFEVRTQLANTSPQISIIGSLENPHGEEMPIVMTFIQVKLKNGERKVFMLPAVQSCDSNIAQLKEFYTGNTEELNTLIKNKRANNFIKTLYYFDTLTLRSITSKTKLYNDSLPSHLKALAQLYDYNLEIGAIERYEKLMNGQGTEEDIQFLIENAILPTYIILAEDTPDWNPPNK